MMKHFFAAVFLSVLAAGALLLPAGAHAEAQGVVAVVNDQPITEFDISQRITLLKVLGESRPEALGRKGALKALVDEQVKIAEAKRFGLTPTEPDINGQIARMAKGMDTTPGGLAERLKKAGIADSTFRHYIGAQIGFNRIIASKYRGDIKISPADVDRKMAEIKSKVDGRMGEILKDPRMKGVTVYSLLEINLPVEGDDSMLLQARAVEASQLLQRFTGCGSVKAAASGIFNVKIGKKVEADGSKLPPPMKAALDKVGPGKAIGPMRNKNGIQLLAFCATRKITPPKPKFEMPTRQQIENSLINEKYDSFEEEYLKLARKSVYVEYRDASYSQ